MKLLTYVIGAILAVCSPALAQTVLVSQVPVSGGGVSRASQLWQDPGPNGNDLDGDSVCFADFVLSAPATIDHLEWWGAGACEQGFRIEFWRQDPGTIAYQPIGVFYYGGDHTVQPTARRDLTSVSTSAGPGGITHYSVDLASPVSLPANDSSNVRWFVSVIGLTSVPYAPWNWSQGTGGSNRTYQFVRGEGPAFRSLGEGRAMLLRTPAGTQITIAASASPAGSGTITGLGSYPAGSTVNLLATPNTGWGFVNWTENGTVVQTQPGYTFTASVNRTLVANFAQAYTITTVASPIFGGTTTGDGTYAGGTNVTVVAAPAAGFLFSEWTVGGSPVSTSATYTFPASANRAMTAQFVPDPQTVVFDFDNAPVHTSLPVSVSASGLGAQLSATGGNFSIQFANALGFTPAGFSGLCIYPNTVFGADLIIDFSQPITAFSIMYSPQELGCDTSATMRATGTLDGVFVATDTTTAPMPGTWPTGTLRLNSVQPFNRVVVHYDSRPPTCQDWGGIFLADNMVVTRASAPCAADFDGNGVREVADIFVFLDAWFAFSPTADFDNSGTIAVPDIFAFLTAWFAGCP